jgi:hypothetical protein
MGMGAQEKVFYFQPGQPVGYCLSVVGFDYQLYLAVAVFRCWLSGVICRWLLLVPGCRVSVVGCWLLLIFCSGCRIGFQVFLLSVPSSALLAQFF